MKKIRSTKKIKYKNISIFNKLELNKEEIVNLSETINLAENKVNTLQNEIDEIYYNNVIGENNFQKINPKKLISNKNSDSNNNRVKIKDINNLFTNFNYKRNSVKIIVKNNFTNRSNKRITYIIQSSNNSPNSNSGKHNSTFANLTSKNESNLKLNKVIISNTDENNSNFTNSTSKNVSTLKLNKVIISNPNSNSNSNSNKQKSKFVKSTSKNVSKLKLNKVIQALQFDVSVNENVNNYLNTTSNINRTILIDKSNSKFKENFSNDDVKIKEFRNIGKIPHRPLNKLITINKIKNGINFKENLFKKAEGKNKVYDSNIFYSSTLIFNNNYLNTKNKTLINFPLIAGLTNSNSTFNLQSKQNFHSRNSRNDVNYQTLQNSPFNTSMNTKMKKTIDAPIIKDINSLLTDCSKKHNEFISSINKFKKKYGNFKDIPRDKEKTENKQPFNDKEILGGFNSLKEKLSKGFFTYKKNKGHTNMNEAIYKTFEPNDVMKRFTEINCIKDVESYKGRNEYKLRFGLVKAETEDNILKKKKQIRSIENRTKLNYLLNVMEKSQLHLDSSMYKNKK